MRLRTLVLCLTLVPAVVFGQAGTGTITGVVTDPAGAVVVNANIEIRNTETNAPYPTVTTGTGAYTVPNLPPGPYSVSVTAPGFKRLSRTGLTVAAGQTIPIDLTLQVGDTAESVTIQAEASLLKTESGDMSHNITLEQLDDLPVLGIGTNNAGSLGIRNPFNSVVFLPGVSYSANFNMIVNGAPTNTAAYRIEGLDATNHVTPPNNFAIQQGQPSADAIQEMAIQTSNYAPEFGQAGGGLFNITMKSGTNQFHGTAYEYYVNEFMNAGDPFSFNSGTPGNPSGGKFRPSNRRNNWGGTFGGPVWLPKIYNGKDKTFFFFSYERYKEDQSLTFTDTLPAAAYQAGNFSAISPNGGAAFNPGLGIPSSPIATDALGRPVYANELFDPSTRRAGPNGVLVADPFEGNIIPLSRFSPFAIAVQKLLPGLSNGNLYANYNGYNLGERITDIPSLKVDQVIGAKHKLSFYFQRTLTNAQFTSPNGNADGLPDLLTGARGSIPIGGPTFRLNHDFTVTPTLLWHAGVGYSLIYFYDDGPYTKSGKTVDCLAMLSLQGCEGSFNFPTIIAGNVTLPLALGGMQQLGNALAHARTHVERPAANANMTWVRGNHTYKAGAEVWWQAYIQAPPTGVGLSFGGLTNNGNPNSSLGTVNNSGATGFPSSLVTGANTTGFPYANFLLGDVTSATQYAPVDSRMFKSQWGVFVQDSWKATRRLTLNYGLRWDYGTPNREEHGRSANLGLTTPNPSAGGRPGAAIFEATCHCEFVKTYPYAIGPRLGVAYQLNDKTVFRGGWGFAYAPPNDLTLENTANITNTPTGVNAYLPLNTPGTIPQPAWPNFDPGQTPLPGSTTSGFLQFVDPNAARPARQNQWSIGIQRELTGNTIIEASYVGNRGVWWSGGTVTAPVGPYGYINQVSPAAFAAYGLNPYTNANDNLLLGQTLASSAVISRVGNLTPYPGYSTSNTLLNALRPFPQFSTIGVLNSPTGRTWYDSLQVKGTKRLSHGLQVNGTFTWSKAFVGIRPVLFVDSTKSLQPTDQPFLFNANIVYTTQSYFANRLAAAAAKDWAIGAFLQYGSGLPLTPPAATNTNYIGGSEMYRVPGQPLYLKDLNCGCINPYTDLVLNPAAWANPANGAFGPATGTLYGDFRQARRPQENVNLSRTFRFKERVSLQIRAEFVNIFNRTQIGNPGTSSPGSAPSRNIYGQYAAGFGVINETISGPRVAPTGTLNAVVGQLYQQPRSGTLIARLTF
jgi:hypothetical protein